MTPLYTKLKEGGLHCLLAFGTGMLLGTIFLHMLPHAVSEHGSPLMVLLGLLTVFVIERLVFDTRHHPEESHAVIGLSAFFGLSVHALIVGLGLSAQLVDPIQRMSLMTSLLIHKFSETFSLVTVFLLAAYSQKKSIKALFIFSLLTPGALVIGHFFLERLPQDIMNYASGLAAGTFLYVALLDLLPEVFHHPKHKWLTFAALLTGIFVMIMISSLSGFSHVH